MQAAEPANPEKGDSWYDTDGGADGQGEAKVYDGSTWDVTGYISHDQLNNVAPADHHDPVTVSAPLTRSGQALALAIGNALTVDGNNDLAVDESAISHDNIAGVSAADHHDPVTVSDPLTEDGTQGLALALASNLRVNGTAPRPRPQHRGGRRLPGTAPPRYQRDRGERHRRQVGRAEVPRRLPYPAL
ncbi:hypothetical protein [Haloarcula marina]|uniref:hypothetical protein n=1 Tax=Haloarcula marina TaxID=2961574 RepID=UPI0020B7A533|nr:hypothetical protein [Halomicroarcula marina]